MKRYKRFRTGFTLVEVMVSIAVIGILASIVTLSFQAYIKNVQQTQVITLADASVKSLKAYALEKNSFPNSESCMPVDSYCCFMSGTMTEPIICEISSNTALNNDLKKYIPNNPTYLPVFKGMQLCTTSPQMSGVSPCTTNNTNKAGVSYKPASPPHTDGAYSSTDNSFKGFLIYYIGGDYKCGADNLLVEVSNSVGNYGSGESLYTFGRASNNATYSAQSTDPDTGYIYNECILGIEAK